MPVANGILEDFHARITPYSKAGDYGPSPWDVPNRLLCPRDAWYPPVEAQ